MNSCPKCGKIAKAGPAPTWDSPIISGAGVNFITVWSRTVFDVLWRPMCSGEGSGCAYRGLPPVASTQGEVESRLRARWKGPYEMIAELASQLDSDSQKLGVPTLALLYTESMSRKVAVSMGMLEARYWRTGC